MTFGRLKFTFVLLVSAFLFGGCVTDSSNSEQPVTDWSSEKIRDIRPGERPALDTAEAGLWMAMDRYEKSLKTSGGRYRNKALNEYVSRITCKLALKHCKDIRVYISRVPAFNASMAPNGVMLVWTGLLLRARNEAQLATVLGHEIGHYLRRHSLQQFETTRDTADFMVFFNIAANIAVGPGVGDLATLAALASLQGFSRDHEREADSLGLQLMANAGYDPREAAKIWKRLVKELKASEKGLEHSFFFASHPHPEERIETLEKIAAAMVEESGAGKINEKEYREIVEPHRTKFLRDELHMQRFKQTDKLMELLLEEGVAAGEINFYRGELIRLKGDKKELEKALEYYDKAIAATGAPVQLYKYMGIVHRKLGNHEKAREAFSLYLERAPDAEDRLMIKSMIEQTG